MRKEKERKSKKSRINMVMPAQPKIVVKLRDLIKWTEKGTIKWKITLRTSNREMYESTYKGKKTIFGVLKVWRKGENNRTLVRVTYFTRSDIPNASLNNNTYDDYDALYKSIIKRVPLEKPKAKKCDSDNVSKQRIPKVECPKCGLLTPAAGAVCTHCGYKLKQENDKKEIKQPSKITKASGEKPSETTAKSKNKQSSKVNKLSPNRQYTLEEKGLVLRLIRLLQDRKEVIQSIAKASNAVFLYQNVRMVSWGKRINISRIIRDTEAGSIVWTEGSERRLDLSYYETSVKVGTTNKSLILYRDANVRQYTLVLYDGDYGVLQPAGYIIPLLRTIKTCRQTRERESLLETVSTESFLVRMNTFRCDNNHSIKDVIAVFKVMRRGGEIARVEAPAAYCPVCRVFYIHEYTYNEVLKYGTPLCQVITEKQYLTGLYKNQSNNLASQSLLRACGYTVNSVDDLSDNQRRRILESIIDNGILPKQAVISYLNYFISFHGRSSRDMSNAVYKWKKDLQYISAYQANTNRRYDVGSVYRIER